MKQDTRSRVVHAIISQIARTGRLTAGQFLECVRMDDKRAILNAVVRLGYLSARHIEACTGIVDDLAGLLQELCEEKRLRPIQVRAADCVLYWVRPPALNEVDPIHIPGRGTADLSQLSSKQKRAFCHVEDEADPITLRHHTALNDLACALHRRSNAVTLGERTLRWTERLLGKFGTSISGRCPDVVAVAPTGSVTVYEVECSKHEYNESDDVARGWNRSSVARVVYITFNAEVQRAVLRCFERVDRTAAEEQKPHDQIDREKLLVVASRGQRLPRLDHLFPVDASRPHRSPDLRRKQRTANTDSTSHPRPHFQSGRPRSSRSAGGRVRARS